MIVNNKPIDVNDYFNLVEGRSTLWECKIGKCRKKVLSPTRAGHLKGYHYKYFGISKQQRENVPSPSQLREKWLKWYNSLPEHRADLK